MPTQRQKLGDAAVSRGENWSTGGEALGGHGLLTGRFQTRGEHDLISFVLSHSVCGNLLSRPQGTRFLFAFSKPSSPSFSTLTRRIS